MKRKVLASATLMVALALAGCGDGGSGGGPISGPGPSPSPSPSPSTSPTASPPASALTQADARMGPCLNMGNHLEPPNEGDWGRAINSTDFAEIRAAGFETVRLPVRWSNHALTTPPYTIDAAFMARVEQVVGQARTAGLRVILNMHHYEDPQRNIFTDPAGQTARFAGLWKQIATKFKDQDNRLVWFELLNEPHDKLNHANLLSVLEPALAEVRATNPTRPVVIGGEFWSGIGSLTSVPLPADANLIVTFHYYDPFNFTHQGAPWITPLQPTGVTYGSTADQNALAADVQKARDFMTRTKRPLFLGEFGAYEGIPLSERAKYYKAVREGFAAAQVDSCAWAYTNTMYLRNPNTNQWVPELLAAFGL